MSTETTNEDTCRPGDPDPAPGCTGDCPAEGGDNTPWPWPWLCTRDAGHSGQHVAAGSELVLAVWTGDGSDLRSLGLAR